MTSPPGTLRYADRYRVLRRLGAGGMATVFLAEDERLDREVAVKRLHADTPEDMARRFDREARLGASLNHPNLVTVFDTVVDPEGVLIVMEYVEGPTLSGALKSGPLAQARALEVLRETAAGLDYAHGLGIVHRDVKPANILLAERGQVKLADLGIAFVAERATHITRTGTVLGTPSYMAPEQLEGREVGPAVDVYALAAVAFEVLSGRKARTGGSPLEIAHRIATEPAPDVREAWAEAPAGLSQALCKGMSFGPADRQGSAGELAEQLAVELGGGAGASTPAARRVRAGAGAGGGAATAAAAGAVAGAGAAGAGAAVPGQDDRAENDLAAEKVEQPAEGTVGEGLEEPGEETIGEGPEEPAHVAAAEDLEEPDAADAAAESPEDAVGPAGEPDRGPDPSDSPPSSGPAAARAPAPAREASPDRAPARRPRPAWLAPVALLLLVAVAAVAGVLALGNEGGGQAQSGDPQVPAESDGSEGSDGAQGAAQGGAAPAASAPEQTVTSFYERAAAGDYAGAWALAGPGFRSQQGGFESFRGGVDTLESIKFEQAESTGAQGDSATVEVRTVATHSDGVDRCQGSLDLARDGANGWLIDRANISCPESTRG